MRDRVIRAAWALATLLTVALSRPLRGKPPQTFRWAVGEGDRIGWAVFSPTRSWATRYHVWAVLAEDDDLWVFDPNSEQWGLTRLATVRPEQVLTFLGRLGAQHVVEVRGERPLSPFVATPVSCVSLTQSALGISAPSAYTPEQLLVYLWEARDGRQDKERDQESR